jgi:protein O-GlcNAc transferase
MEKVTLKHKLLLLVAFGFFFLAFKPFIAKQSSKRADDFFNQGYLNFALRHYKRAILLCSDYTYAYNQLGVLYEEMGKGDEAIKIFKKSVEVNPKNKLGYLELGRIYHQKKMYDLANIYFKRGLSLD